MKEKILIIISFLWVFFFSCCDYPAVNHISFVIGKVIVVLLPYVIICFVDYILLFVKRNRHERQEAIEREEAERENFMTNLMKDFNIGR